MKRTYYFIFVFLAITSSGELFSQSNQVRLISGASNDTLLFDGDSQIQIVKNADGCHVKVKYVKGKVRGKHIETRVVETCQGPNYLVVEVDDELKNGSELMPGAEIHTGDDSRVELEFPDGSTMRVGSNSDMTVGDCDFQEESKFNAKFILGSMWAEVEHLVGGDVFDISTDRAVIGTRGTKFNVESRLVGNDTVVTLRTFEGNVEFKSSFDNSNDAKNIAARNQKLGEDYLAGKITLEEYTKKISETNSNTLDVAGKYKVMVETGHMSSIKGNGAPTEPVLIKEEDNPWYLDINFYGK